MYDMNFASIVFDKHGMPRELDKNTCAITTSLPESEIEDLISRKCSGLSDIEFGLNVMMVDDYFLRIYKYIQLIRGFSMCTLFYNILYFYAFGIGVSFVIIWFLSHEKTNIRLLSAFLVGITWPISLPVALLFSLF